MHSSRSHDAAIRVYDAAGNVIETHDHTACLQRLDSEAMETLAKQIEHRMHGEWRHCAIYERDLERFGR
jgi:hypothetical protein